MEAVFCLRRAIKRIEQLDDEKQEEYFNMGDRA